MAWGISEKASEKEKIKAEANDHLKGLNSCGIINYKLYCELFDFFMPLLDKMYEHGVSKRRKRKNKTGA